MTERAGKTPWTRRTVYAVLGIAAVVLLVRAFRPVAVRVDVATVQRGRLLVTADDDGRTRVRERYTISAPIDGRLLRTPLDPGDAVRDGETLVAEFAPVAPSLLDARSRGEAEARVRRAEAALQEARARLEQAGADHGYAETELVRIRGLAEQGMRSQEALDRAERDRRMTFEGKRAATFGVQVAQFELELAEASLAEPDESGEVPARDFGGDVAVGVDGRLLLHSPIDGQVLRVFEESARTMPAGTPILEVGNTRALELVADYLSQDAVKVEPGMAVLVEGWGGELPDGRERVLRGRVRVVEPGGYTKVSALGVEEQRVDIVVDPVGDDADWAALGDGYRVELRIVLWSADDVLIVPTGALFRIGGAWSVYAVAGGVATRRGVRLGRMTGLEAQVLDGLADGDRVVLYPSELIGEGTPVEAR